MNGRIGLAITTAVGTMAKAADGRSEQTYRDAEAVLHEAMQIQQHLAAQDAMLASLIAATKAAMPPPAQPA